MNCDLDGRALGGRTAQRRFALPWHHMLEIIWAGLMWELGMLSDKALGWEELEKSTGWQLLRHFQPDLQIWGQGAVCQDCWSCSFLLCPPLCLPYGKRRKLQLRISVGERCAFQLRLRQHEMMPVPKKDVVVGKDSLGAVKPPNDAAPSSSHGLLGKPGI